MSKQASEAAVPLWNTEQQALTMAFQLCSQFTTSHFSLSPFNSFPSFYCPFCFLFCLSQPHKCTHSISRPDLSHRRLADGDFLKYAGTIIAPCQAITRPADEWALPRPFTVHITSSSPTLFTSPSPCLLSKALPSLGCPLFTWTHNYSSWMVTSGGRLGNQSPQAPPLLVGWLLPLGM